MEFNGRFLVRCPSGTFKTPSKKKVNTKLYTIWKGIKIRLGLVRCNHGIITLFSVETDTLNLPLTNLKVSQCAPLSVNHTNARTML